MQASDKIDPKRLAQARQTIKHYFNSEFTRRFRLEGLAGAGANGVAWKVKFVPEAGGLRYRLVLKMSLKTVAATTRLTSLIENEKHWLAILQRALHIVKPIYPYNDPLGATFPNVPTHGLGEWIYLEWVEGGSLGDFIDRAKHVYKGPLPNRLLWRFFLCLIRMCIGMGWPPSVETPVPVPEQVPEIPLKGHPRRIVHADMHDENILIGPMDASSNEHMLTPLLKLIDFGNAYEMVRLAYHAENGVSENIYGIGSIMAALVTYDRSIAGDLWPVKGAGMVRVRPRRPPIRTAAVFLLPDPNGVEPYPHLDPDLRNLILACTAAESTDRPLVRALEKVAETAIDERTGQWYASQGAITDESDENIQRIVQQLIFNANVNTSAW